MPLGTFFPISRASYPKGLTLTFHNIKKDYLDYLN